MKNLTHLRKKKPARMVAIGLLLAVQTAVGQAPKTSADYLNRARETYTNVWRRYRVPAHNLFSENYPSNRNDTLTYMQGGNVKEKAVSFLWPFSGMFSATNVLLKVPSERKAQLHYLDSLVTGIEAYRDSSRSPVGYQAYPVQFEKSDRYYDDNGLVGIDYMEAYLNTQNPLYLKRAKDVFTFILSGWDDELGGGVTWLEGHRDQKPACSNGMATLTALKLYQGTKDPQYLQWGKKFYNWMHTSLLDSTGVYANDRKATGAVNRVFYTYNSGSMLEAAVLLYQFTGDKQYLKQAEQLAKDTYVHFSKQKHPASSAIQIDLPWFVTVLFRGYEALYRVNGDYQYITKIKQSLDYAWQNSRDQYGLVTHSWTPQPAELAKPKWLLDEACIAELYARLSLLEKERETKK
ncbi:glycoside hydrolase family 76 protein [Spirosoma sp. RP8]|uniref:Glycoside hydrolase family 76 protein n=1 Tax=Spirosoma liriopis TaxID=2937440 RepID=A0ABT0HRZ2_9BACT|nr:glycoside hydrolase family 76 protein [Spirosoma liriopis]MCK8494755.1 glycoside hydrolase family 76 protein [Spirosoma liriopis]